MTGIHSHMLREVIRSIYAYYLQITAYKLFPVTNLMLAIRHVKFHQMLGSCRIPCDRTAAMLFYVTMDTKITEYISEI